MRARLACCTLVFVVSLCSSAVAADPFWHTAYPSTDGFSLHDVSCATPTLCIAVGDSGEAVVQDGDSQYETRPESVPTLTAISCAPGTRFCMAADDQGGVVAWRDGQFGPVDNIDDDFELQSVSCPTATFCMAIDREDATFKYANDSWAKLPLSNKPAVGVYANLNRVACASPTFCVALTGATNGMRYATWNGTAWTDNTSKVLGETSNPKSLSCTAQTFCLATTSSGNADRFNGTSWTVTPVSNTQLWAGCAGTTCRAIDQNVRGYSTTNGTDWTGPTDLTGSTSFSLPSAVTCVASDLCVATSGGLTTTFARSIIPTIHPVLSGATGVGATLTLAHAPVDETRAWYVDQWFRCDNPGSNTCVQIAGVRGNSYTLTAADAGKYVEARDITGIGLDQEGATPAERAFISNAIKVDVPPAPAPAASTGSPPESPAPAPPAPSGSKPPGASGPLPSTSPAARVRGKVTTSQTTASIPLTCAVACSGKLTLTVKKKKVGSAVYAVGAGKTKRVAVRLSKLARTTLRRHHKLKVTLTLTPSTGRRTTITLTLTRP
jgi:hypothetical protein